MGKPLLATTGIGLALVALLLGAFGTYAYFWDETHRDVIAPGVRVAGVEIGGMSQTRARALLTARLVTPLSTPVRLDAGTHRFMVDPGNAGLRVDVDRMLHVAVEKSRSGGLLTRAWHAFWGKPSRVSVPLRAAISTDALATYAQHIAQVVDRPPLQARVVPSEKSLRVVPGRDGVAVDRGALQRALAQTLLRPGGLRVVHVPTHPVHPRWQTANLPKRYPAFIIVDREAYTLRLFRHLKLYKTYPIAVGRQGLETPQGLYDINDKQINPSWHVPKSAWAGSLAGQIIPPGPSDPIKARWMGFWDGAGIHGTDETWSIGHSASHGCIRMLIPDVIQLYSLVPLNTPIYVG